MPGIYNTRTGLGGFADRVGAMAYALTPFTVALSTRESILSLITGVPYQHFNFLHRWTGRIIFLQSFLHTLSWTIVEGRLYQPQPKVYKTFIQEQYIIFGVVAQLFITFLYIFSTSWAIRWTGYEFFKRSHYVIAILYLGACWGHWDGLACWMVAALILLGLDKGARLVGIGFLHMGPRKGKSALGFRSATATIQHFGDDKDSVVRIDFDFEHHAWPPGAHFYLCFPALSLWQSHPFTPASAPDGRSKVQHHTYLVRVQKGITARLAKLAQENGDQAGKSETAVILTGPYAGSNPDTSSQNLMAIAGGTGVTSVLPAVLDALTCAHIESRIVEFVWIVRYIRDLDWIAAELAELKSHLTTATGTNLRVRIFVTRDSDNLPISEAYEKEAKSHNGKGKQASLGTTDLKQRIAGFEIVYLGGQHPVIEDVVEDFHSRAAICGGASQVIGSGPAEIGTLLREAIAKRNNVRQLWEGDETGALRLDWDCRS